MILSRPSLRSLSAALLFCWLLPGSAPGQMPTPMPAATPAPVPSANVVATAELDLTALSKITADLATRPPTSQLQDRLATITTGVQTLSAQTTSLLDAPATGSALQTAEGTWQTLKSELADLDRSLKAEADQLGVSSQSVNGMMAKWTATQATAKGLPTEITARIHDILSKFAEANRTITTTQTAILKLQGDAAVQQDRINEMLSALEKARTAALNDLLVPDSHPLWDVRALRATASNSQTSSASFQAQIDAVGAYLWKNPGRPLLQLFVWISFLVAFRWANRRAGAWGESNPELRRSTRIFDVPIAAASGIALALGSIFYPASPPLLLAILDAALLIPLLIVIQRLVEPFLMPLTWGLAIFFLAGKVRESAAGFPSLARLILLGETLAAAGFAIWLHRATGASARRALAWKIMRAVSAIAAAAFAFAALANVLGYANLALFLTHQILAAAFSGLLLYAAVHVLDGLATFALCVPPLSLLALVQNHRTRIERRLALILRTVTAGLWAWFVADQLSLVGPIENGLGYLLEQQLRFGPVTALALMEFAVTLWAAFLASRLARVVLDEEVYGHLRLAPGMSFAVSTMIHYAILFAGFYLAAAILVGDMTKFTILAGAFSVGIGFGLQNVVNNFVSGIIVLFERPIKLGDVIQVDSNIGSVERIGIRATVVRLSDGSEVIVPNGNLISNPVTNWTLSSPQRSIDISIATPGTMDPQRVLDLLIQIATAQPRISHHPAPRAELTKMGGGLFNFDLYACTAEVAAWTAVRSELTIAIHSALLKEGITIS